MWRLLAERQRDLSCRRVRVRGADPRSRGLDCRRGFSSCFRHHDGYVTETIAQLGEVGSFRWPLAALGIWVESLYVLEELVLYHTMSSLVDGVSVRRRRAVAGSGDCDIHRSEEEEQRFFARLPTSAIVTDQIFQKRSPQLSFPHNIACMHARAYCAPGLCRARFVPC